MTIQTNIEAAPVSHEAGTILLLCTGCDMERDTPVAHCPSCECRTVSYEYVVGFDYRMAKLTNEVLRDGLLNAIVPPSLVAPLLATEPMPGVAAAWRSIR